MLTIVAAMEQELVGLKRALGPRPPPGLDLHVIGIGRDRVEPGLRGLLPTLRQQRQGAEPPTELLLLGFAGGGPVPVSRRLDVARPLLPLANTARTPAPCLHGDTGS